MYDQFNGINPTQPPELTKIKSCERQCPNCHKTVKGSCHTEKRFVVAAGKPHWREHCLTCDFWRNPYTGQFDVKSGEAGLIWNQYLRASDEHRIKIRNKFIQKVIDQQDFGRETITFYGPLEKIDKYNSGD